MSKDSKWIAERFAALKERQVIEHKTNLKRGELLDEGFSRFRDDLIAQLLDRADDLNHEPQVGNILEVSFADPKRGSIMRKDLGTSLYITFDSARHTVTLTVAEPVKYDYTVEVRLSGDSWYYAGGERKERGDTVKADWLAHEGLKRLLGVA